MMPSLLDDKEDEQSHADDVQKPTSPEQDALAVEVGRSAHNYLEECFYTEVSVLDRDKFEAVPEIVKSDFALPSRCVDRDFVHMICTRFANHR